MKAKQKTRIGAVKWAELLLLWTASALTAAAFVYCIVMLAQHAADGKPVGEALNHMFMAALGALFLWLPYFVRKLFKLYFPSYLLMLYFLFVFVHFVPGEVFRLYDKSFLFDKFLHALSGVLTAFAGVSLGYGMLRPKNGEKPTIAQIAGILLFGFCISLAVEFLWECAEFTCDRIGSSNMQRYKDGILTVDPAGYPSGSVVSSLDYGTGLRDTMWDMLVTVFGALAVTALSLVVLLKKPAWAERNTICPQKRFNSEPAPLPTPAPEREG